MSSAEIKKVVRDGKVAVLYSRGFGAGWFTWNTAHPQCLYSPEIVALVEAKASEGEINAEAERLFNPDGTGHFFAGGSDGLTIEWLPVGTHFRIHEYDGAESVETRDEMDWSVA